MSKKCKRCGGTGSIKIDPYHRGLRGHYGEDVCPACGKWAKVYRRKPGEATSIRWDEGVDGRPRITLENESARLWIELGIETAKALSKAIREMNRARIEKGKRGAR